MRNDLRNHESHESSVHESETRCANETPHPRQSNSQGEPQGISSTPGYSFSIC